MSRNEEEKPNILGTEPVLRLMLKYSIPSVVSMLVMSLYNIIDQIFIGRGVGFLGNAATTVAFPLVTAGLGLALLTGNGAAAYISLELGRGKSASAKKALGNAMFMLIILSLALSIVSLAFLRPLLKLLAATDDVMPYAIEYTGIILVGLPFSMFSTAVANVIRADGSPRYSMFCQLAGAVLNTILDPIFIFVFKMGVKGAAIATVIAQIVSFSLVIYYLLHKAKYVRVSLSDLNPDPALIKRISGLGSSSFVNQVSMVLVTLVLNRSLVYYGGLSDYGSNIPLAALGIVMKINMILISTILGTSIGLQPILGFNYGSENYDRVKHAFRIGVTATGTLALIVNILFIAVPQIFIGIFGDTDPKFNEFACIALSTYMGAVATAGIQIPSSMFFMAIGKPLKAMLLTSVRSVLALIPLLLIFPLFWGLSGILYACPAADILSFSVTLFFITKELRGLKPRSEPLAAEVAEV